MSFRDLFGSDVQVGDVASPCVQICVIEPDDGLCVGCARTLDEIASWGAMSNDARLAVMKILPQRRRPTIKFD